MQISQYVASATEQNKAFEQTTLRQTEFRQATVTGVTTLEFYQGWGKEILWAFATKNKAARACFLISPTGWVDGNKDGSGGNVAC